MLKQERPAFVQSRPSTCVTSAEFVGARPALAGDFGHRLEEAILDPQSGGEDPLVEARGSSLGQRLGIVGEEFVEMDGSLRCFRPLSDGGLPP